MALEMEKEQAKNILNSLIERSVKLQEIRRRDSPDFEKWKRDTRVAITNIFESSTQHIQDFENLISILYSPSYATTGLQYHGEYVKFLQNSAAILQSMIDEIDQYWPSTTPKTKETSSSPPINIFYAYAKEDEDLRIQLEKHLSLMNREGIISGWHFRMLIGGDEWKGEIDHHINNSQIILLLISSDFISSDYCYDVEMNTAMKLHNSKKARVIPIILRPVDWQTSPFSKLQALPTDGKPATQWPNQDQAFLDIAQGIRKTCQKLLGLKIADIQVSSVSHNTSPSLEGQTTNVYCARCGAVPGDQPYCTDILDPYHQFKSYSGKVYCARCGATPGQQTYCTDILDPYHQFKSYP